MNGVGTISCKHFSQLKIPWGLRCPGNSHFNTIVLIAMVLSETEEITINQLGNAIDLASAVNLKF